MAPRLRKNEMLTARRLREVLDYDAETGEFRRKESRARTAKVKWDDPTNPTANGYLIISVDGTHYNAHRLAWLYVHGEFPDSWIHHLNGDRHDNRIANLALKKAKTNPSVPLTLERLQEVLRYDPSTGVFIWKKGTARGRVGAQAGVLFGAGYRYISVDGQKYLAHRLAWFWSYGKWPDQWLDHINGATDDNRIANLREASAAQNAQNARHKAGVSGYRGVRAKGRRFEAVIHVNNFRKSLGWFDSAEEAHKAYVKAAQEHHGAFVPNGDTKT